jgi:hypothetical protein
MFFFWILVVYRSDEHENLLPRTLMTSRLGLLFAMKLKYTILTLSLPFLEPFWFLSVTPKGGRRACIVNPNHGNIVS